MPKKGLAFGLALFLVACAAIWFVVHRASTPNRHELDELRAKLTDASDESTSEVDRQRANEHIERLDSAATNTDRFLTSLSDWQQLSEPVGKSGGTRLIRDVSGVATRLSDKHSSLTYIPATDRDAAMITGSLQLRNNDDAIDFLRMSDVTSAEMQLSPPATDLEDINQLAASILSWFNASNSMMQIGSLSQSESALVGKDLHKWFSTLTKLDSLTLVSEGKGRNSPAVLFKAESNRQSRSFVYAQRLRARGTLSIPETEGMLVSGRMQIPYESQDESIGTILARLLYDSDAQCWILTEVELMPSLLAMVEARNSGDTVAQHVFSFLDRYDTLIVSTCR